MSKTIRNMSLAFALMVMAAPMLGTDVQAKSNFMAECSAKFKAAKASNAPEGSMKWTDFMKTQCAADAAAAEPAPVTTTKAKAKVAKPAIVTTTTPSGSFIGNCSAAWKDLKAKNAVPVGMTWKSFVAAKCVVPASAAGASTDAAGGTFMQKCSLAWKAMKDAGTTPAGMSWKDFVAGKCVATGAVAATTKKTTKKAVVVDTTDDEMPTEADAVSMDQTPLKTVDKNGKAFTPGQLAAHQRARDCGFKWRSNKASFQSQYGTWPKYWSACNAELKAQAQ